MNLTVFFSHIFIYSSLTLWSPHYNIITQLYFLLLELLIDQEHALLQLFSVRHCTLFHWL